MKFNLTLFLIYLIFSPLLSSQTKEIDSVKAYFLSIYKEIYKEVPPEEIQQIADSLIMDYGTDKTLSIQMEDFINSFPSLKIKEYNVIEGDCLWTIAERETGNGYNWSKIYEINDTLIKNPDLIYPNQKIKLLLITKNITPDSTFSRLAAALLVDDKKEIVPNENNDSVSTDILEIENMIVDETLSKIGKDYFDLFYTKWESQVAGIVNYSIVIYEKTLPQRGTQISIKVNDLDIYQSFIQPRYELIEQSVDEGIYMVFSYLQNYEAIQKELEKGDMKGTGIY